MSSCVLRRNDHATGKVTMNNCKNGKVGVWASIKVKECHERSSLKI